MLKMIPNFCYPFSFTSDSRPEYFPSENTLQTPKWFNDESKKYLKEMIIHPVGQIMYNEFYIYLWLICIYHVFLIFLVLANLYFLLYSYRTSFSPF
jgi:hypothetical protein